MATQAVNKDVGDRATPQWSWTVGGTATDPTQIVVKQQDADGVETTITTEANPAALTAASEPLARVSTGIFKLNPGVALTKAGYWLIRVEATGVAEAAAPDFLYKVGPTEFYDNAGLGTRNLVGLQETKDWLQQQNIGAPDDLELARVISDISQRAHDEAQREFKPINGAAGPRTFPVDQLGIRTGVVHVGDLTSFTQVQILDTDWTTVLETVDTADITAHPIVREAWEPIRRLEFYLDVTQLRHGMRVKVTGVWGFPAVPGNVRQAVLDAVAAIMDREVEHYSQDLGASGGGESGVTIVYTGGRMLNRSMPPSSLAVLWSYRDLNIG